MRDSCDGGAAGHELSAHMRICQGKPTEQARAWLSQKPAGSVIIWRELLQHGPLSTWKAAVAALRDSGHYVKGARRGQWLRTRKDQPNT